MEITQQYKDRVSLLLDILPIVAKRKCFALKGGTALNLFIWEMPRLSVDIDLVYLPISDRDEALKDISANLTIIKDELEKIALGSAKDFSMISAFSFFAIVIASINIFGGFFVTWRMLQMFKK